GEAIAIGMALAFRFSEEMGLVPAPASERAIAHLEAVGLPTRIAQMSNNKPSPAQLLKLIHQDKKVSAGKPAFILVRGIGEAFVDGNVSMERLEAFLARACGEL
ncbi:MAG: 3-dehydroquinate synthase, partial [Pseudomonadota bacterium]|nr:3-dehydroquinate synthase [Pseudomonadota bacterium]